MNPVANIPQVNPQIRPNTTVSLPNTDSMQAASKKERRSAKQMAEFLKQQYDNFLPIRRDHSIAWMKIHAIMRGYHWFRVEGGSLKILGKSRDPREVRAVMPLMKPMKRWELGRMNANQIGCTARPITGASPDSFWVAERAQVLMSSWAEESDLESFDEKQNQQLIHYGLSAAYPYVYERSDGSKQVKVKAIPAPEIFPVPYTAKDWDELDGIMHVTFASRGWLESMDAAYEREHGTPPPKKMVDAIGKVTTGMHVNSPTLGMSSGSITPADTEGALVFNAWLKSTPTTPGGEWIMMVGDEIYRYRTGVDQNGKSLVLHDDNLPLYPVYYHKDPESFLGTGFLEELIGPQLEKNRQISRLIQSSLENRQKLIFDPDLIDAKDLQKSSHGLIPSYGGALQDGGTPVFKIDPVQITQDQVATINVVDQAAEKAAGYESRIIYGQSEGRVDSGAANSMLNTNAQVPLQDVMDRKFRTYKKLYPVVLGLLKTAWTGSKRVRILGTHNMGREMMFSQQEIPTCEQVILTPNPLIAGGRNTLANVLFQLRQMPGKDGGFEIEDYEFRRSLKMLDMSPPGIDLIDKAEQRIQERIAALVGDGKRLHTQPAGTGNGVIDAQQSNEDHRLAVKFLKERILESAFRFYSPIVQKALVTELRFHKSFTYGAIRHPDDFDNDMADADAAQAEKYLDAAEQDLETNEGLMSLNGNLVGV